jgi:hypothetical protein
MVTLFDDSGIALPEELVLVLEVPGEGSVRRHRGIQATTMILYSLMARCEWHDVKV